MKNAHAILLASVTLVAGLTMNNLAMSAYDGLKVAKVDVSAVVAKSAQMAQLRKEHQAKTEELRKYVQNAKADIQKQQTKEAKDKLLKKYDAELAKKKEAATKDYMTKLKKIDENITATIQQQAQAQGYGLVLTKSTVLYGADDITASVQKAVK
ncbi:OmpH family outer membrane protein [bacterium]|nr:OmpH family outer membrane protein [bacterium]